MVAGSIPSDLVSRDFFPARAPSVGYQPLEGMHVLALSPAQVAHAVKRFRAYRNSPSAIARHFRNRGERARERLCGLVHRLEIELGIDLGALCGRFVAREEPGVPAFERAVLEWLAHWATPAGGEGEVLLVRVDRVRTLNALAEGGALELREEALVLARAFERRADAR